jgi:protein-disulfide isomerase
MEESMCWEIDYKFLAEQKKAQERRIEQQRRADLIDQLLNDANQQGKETKVEGTPAKEVAPAK